MDDFRSMQKKEENSKLHFSTLNKITSLSNGHQWLLKPLNERLVDTFLWMAQGAVLEPVGSHNLIKETHRH